MPANNYLPDVLETTEAEHLATGFIFTEGPLWHRTTGKVRSRGLGAFASPAGLVPSPLPLRQNGMSLSRSGDRGFESTSLQQGVRCEPVCHEPRRV
jgi:hypothetical protein